MSTKQVDPLASLKTDARPLPPVIRRLEQASIENKKIPICVIVVGMAGTFTVCVVAFVFVRDIVATDVVAIESLCINTWFP